MFRCSMYQRQRVHENLFLHARRATFLDSRRKFAGRMGEQLSVLCLPLFRNYVITR